MIKKNTKPSQLCCHERTFITDVPRHPKGVRVTPEGCGTQVCVRELRKIRSGDLNKTINRK